MLGEEDGITRLAYISFLFALRVPSESLLIRRSHNGGRGDLVPAPAGEGFDRAKGD